MVLVDNLSVANAVATPTVAVDAAQTLQESALVPVHPHKMGRLAVALVQQGLLQRLDHLVQPSPPPPVPPLLVALLSTPQEPRMSEMAKVYNLLEASV
jgi:hypothetical protein